VVDEQERKIMTMREKRRTIRKAVRLETRNKRQERRQDGVEGSVPGYESENDVCGREEGIKVV